MANDYKPGDKDDIDRVFESIISNNLNFGQNEAILKEPPVFQDGMDNEDESLTSIEVFCKKMFKKYFSSRASNFLFI